jgi:hypothetical protein
MISSTEQIFSEVSSVPVVYPPEALKLLMQAHTYAQTLGRARWDFAVEIHVLLATGATTSDLRWLVCKGYANHAIETTLSAEEHRTFRPVCNLKFCRRSCFALTEAGVAAIQQARESLTLSRVTTGIETLRHVPPIPPPKIPRWDSDRQELCVNNVLVKQFKVPAPNQEMILTVFEEDGWPVHIDDPLPPQINLEPKQRLHDTINSLNRNQKNRLLHFSGDGHGKGVRWKLIMTGADGFADSH